jgi:magnesium-transporting ATPase (P-type)
VKDAITQCHQAGIRVTMVTGDYGLTAEAIAQQIGLLDDSSNDTHEPVRVVTGESMGHLSDAQLQQIVKYRSKLVFARMSPEHKLRLVQAYKATGARGGGDRGWGQRCPSAPSLPTLALPWG